MDRKQAIEHINKIRTGTKTELISIIGENLYNQFKVMGFIYEVPKSTDLTVYQITQSGIKDAEFYREPTAEEAKMGVWLANKGLTNC